MRWNRFEFIAALLLAACSGGQPPKPADVAERPVPPEPLEAVDVFTDCTDGCPQMVPIPAGRFEMGSSPEEQRWYGVPSVFANQESPRHTVVIAKAFALGRNEVSRAEYARFVEETGRAPDPKGCSVRKPDSDVWAYNPERSWRDPGIAVTDQHPVNCVNWFDARAYAAWLSKKTGQVYRLPSEAEWEYAARGGTTTAAYWGDNSEPMCKAANVMNHATYLALNEPESWRSRLMCSGRTTFTLPVGSFPANPFGLNDMIGNVWEWVEDCARSSYIGAAADGSAWKTPACDKRTLRGGAFHSAPFFGRAASRETQQIPDHVGLGAGFRVLRELGDQKPALQRIVLAAPIVGDPVAGERQYAPCSKCHSVVAADGDTSLGPNLHNLFGKKAGTLRPYPYSEPLKSSGVVWTEKTLDAFIRDPAAMVPYNTMTFVGESDRQARANIVAYLKVALR